MSNIGTWIPNQEKEERQQPIDKEVLNRFIAIGLADQLESLEQHLGAEDIAGQKHLMKKHKDVWADISQKFTIEELVQLVRFFTLAEMQLVGWEAGSLSPVIWLCRALKSRGAFPDPDLISWIKAHTNNQFLPYGNILDL